MDKVQELLIKMLKRNDFFKHMDDEKLLKFSNLFKLDMATKGDAIIIEGHNPEYVYILKNWTLLAKKANWLNSVVLGQINEGETFGEMSFFYNKPAMASVVCDSDSASFWKISKKDFKEFLDDNPEIKTKIMEILSRREKENKQKLWWKLDIKPSADLDWIDDIQINL